MFIEMLSLVCIISKRRKACTLCFQARVTDYVVIDILHACAFLVIPYSRYLYVYYLMI